MRNILKHMTCFTRFLVGVGFLAVLAGGALEAQAAAKLRFANFPSAGTFPCVSMERWAEELRLRTNGAVTIETFPGGTLLDAKNMVRGVMQGQADIGCISLAYHAGAYPLLSVFELPLGFTTAEAASEALWNTYEKYQPAETAKVKVIALFGSAPSQIMSTKPLKSLDDVKGLTLRAAGSLADVAFALGASPVSMPQSDAPEALQKGVVQGVFSSLDVLKDYNFAESCRYGLEVDMPIYPFMMFMNMKTWNALAPEVQQAITDLAREHSVWTGRYVDEHGKKARQWAEETHGVVLETLNQQDTQRIMEQTAGVVTAWEKRAGDKKVDAAAVLDFVRSEKKRLEP